MNTQERELFLKILESMCPFCHNRPIDEDSSGVVLLSSCSICNKIWETEHHFKLFSKYLFDVDKSKTNML